MAARCPVPVPPNVTGGEAIVVFHSIGKPAGMRISIPLAAVIDGNPLASVIVITCARVDGSLKVKDWLAADEIEGAPPTAQKLVSTLQLVPRLFTSSWRLFGVEGAAKFWKRSPPIVSVWPARKLLCRAMTAVLLFG